MKKVETQSNFGRFGYTASTVLGDEVNAGTVALALEGMQSVCFRAGGSDAEKALKDCGLMANDQKRGDVVFSDEAMQRLQAAFTKKIGEICGKKGFPEIVIRFTGEHVFGESGEGGSRKRATEHVDVLMGKAERMPNGMTGEELLRLSLSVHNPEAMTADRAKLIEIAHEGMFATKKGGK